MPDLEKGLCKTQICVVVGHEEPGMRPMNDKEYRTTASLLAERRQIPKMAGPPFCDRIRKHGHPISKQGTGFDLEKDLFSSPLKEKIKTTAPDPHFRGFHLPSFEAWHLSMIQKKSGHFICPMGMKHNDLSFPFHSHHSVCGLSGMSPLLSDEIEASARKEKLAESARVREEGLDNLPSTLASDQEPIQAGEEGRLHGPLKEPQPSSRSLIFPFGQIFAPLRWVRMLLLNRHVSRSAPASLSHL